MDVNPTTIVGTGLLALTLSACNAGARPAERETAAPTADDEAPAATAAPDDGERALAIATPPDGHDHPAVGRPAGSPVGTPAGPPAGPPPGMRGPGGPGGPGGWPGGGEPPWVRNRRAQQDRVGGLPQAVLDQQVVASVPEPDRAQAIATALAEATEAAAELIDTGFHTGRTLVVPDEYPAIQAAIDAAQVRDTVLVRAGTYYELLVMKDGVRLMSDPGDGGETLDPVPGAQTRLPRRTLRTIVDGSRSTPSSHGMIDFQPGTGRTAVVDGLTLQNLPEQNHHVPGHAHAINVRGAGAVVMHCLVRRCGSTGIGNHVVYRDQAAPLAERDFRYANILHQASAVIYRNVIHGNLGLGIGCNHFSSPFILGNEVFDNDDSALGETPGPGIGAKHGASPTVIGNLIYRNPGGGVLCKAGDPQGAHPIDRKTRATVRFNVVYGNGTDRPAIACDGGGSAEAPAIYANNWVLQSGLTGIGLRGGATAVVENNLVSNTTRVGISVNASVALKLNGNRVRRTGAPGIAIVAGATVAEMRGNAAEETEGPRFMLRDSTIEAPH